MATGRWKPRTWCVPGAVMVALVWTIGCGGSAPVDEASAEAAPATAATPAAAAAGGLTPFEEEHGIGPVKEPVALPASIDRTLAGKGEAIFEQKCSACHKLGERYVGPPLGEVLGRRSPTFVMNMVLNPLEMAQRHPVTKQLLAQYLSYMPNQDVTRDDARAVVEFFRTQQPAVSGGQP